jgi:hypothetical protein
MRLPRPGWRAGPLEPPRSQRSPDCRPGQHFCQHPSEPRLGVVPPCHRDRLMARYCQVQQSRPCGLSYSGSGHALKVTLLQRMSGVIGRRGVPAGVPALACRCRIPAAAASSTLVSMQGGPRARGLAARCVSPPFGDSLDRRTRHGPVPSLSERRAESLIRPDLPTSLSNSHRHPAVVARRRPPEHDGPPWSPWRLDHPPTSGLRAGTPDRRGKRGEVGATFAMITTEPTWSIGELGLGITPRTLAPNISHA